MLVQKVQELADRAHAEHDLKKAAKEIGATVKSSDLVSPSGQVPDIGAMSGPASAAFELKNGEISGPLSLGDKGSVLQITEKQEASPDEFAKQKDQIRETLLDSKRQMRLELFISGVRQRMEKEGKIRINKDEWTRVMGAPPATT
jgi:peptidyl-prolyl cis-trans isomerase D